VRQALDPDLLQTEIDAAREQFQHGKPAVSLTRLRTIRARIDRAADERWEVQRLRAQVMVSQASAKFEVDGRLDEALDLLESARSWAAESGADAVLASVRGQRGLLLLRAGRTDAALAAFDEAEVFLDVADANDRILILLNRGVLHLERGSLSKAEEDLARCLEAASATGDDARERIAQHNLGYVDFLAGRLPKAIARIESAAAEHPVSLLDRARVLREAGLVADAETILERASELFAEARLQQDLAETELVRAECALVDGNAKQARALAISAYRRFARRHNLRWQRKAELMRLRADRAAADEKGPHGRRTSLLDVADRAADLSDACRREGRRDLARTASLLAQEARLRAVDEAPSAVPAVRALDTVQDRMQTREVRALAAWRSGTRSRAATEVRKGLAELGSYQHSFGSLDLRTASAVHGSALAKLGLHIAFESGSPTAVLDVIELGRAISTRLPLVRPPSDAVTADLLTELRTVEESARGLEGDASSEPEIELLRTRGSQLQKAIRARAWELEGDRGDAESAPRSGELRAAARESDVVFVTFARNAGRWVAVVLDGRRSSLYDLADIAEVAGLVQRVRADLDVLAMPAVPPPLKEAVRRSVHLGLTRLDRLLVEPLRMAGRPAVLSCSGDLLFLPWGLTPGRVGISTVVTPSAATWLQGRRRARPETPRVLAVAGPDLRLSAAEATAVAGVWEGAEALVGAAATAAATHGGLVRNDVLHVAAHGAHRPENPLFSSVRLSDGPLFAYEIDPEEGLAGCVFLSACEAGLATTRPGDENLGLASVLLQLGSTTVVAGVARVNDEVSAGVMTKVHEDLRQGIDVSASLAARLHETLDRHTPAALLCFGSTW